MTGVQTCALPISVRLFERFGASAIQLEDQSLPKRCGHLAGKTLVSRAEMTGKIHAALDARTSEATLIVARTDAIAVEGIEAALDRAHAYAEAGADVLFIEAPQDEVQFAAIMERFRGQIPLLASSASAVVLATGQSQDIRYTGVAAALDCDDVQLRLFAKPEIDGQRRLGVALASAKTVEEAVSKAKSAAAAVKVLL